MPKARQLPEYETDHMVELIRQHIHNRVNRRMLYLRLIGGETFEKIGQIIFNEENISFDTKTIRTRVRNCEAIVFKHYP